MMQSFDQSTDAFAEGTAGAGAPVALASPASASPERDARQLVVIVEDDRDLIPIYVEMCEQECGWRTAAFTDGQEALRRIRELRPDMLLLDLKVPGLDGKDLRRMLRGWRETVNLPVLVVTHMAPYMVEQARLEPVSVVYKPFERDGLLKALREVMASAPGSSNAPAQP